MTAIVDTIADLLKDALEQQEFAGDAEISCMSLPEFELMEAADRTQIKVSGYEVSNTNHHNRGEVIEDCKVGIGIVRKVEMTSGQPDETAFRELKSLGESIRKWGWTAVEGYTAIMSEQPALFDLEKAKSGTFFTVVNITYRVGFNL